jgi:hypothetical protein
MGGKCLGDLSCFLLFLVISGMLCKPLPSWNDPFLDLEKLEMSLYWLSRALPSAMPERFENVISPAKLVAFGAPPETLFKGPDELLEEQISEIATGFLYRGYNIRWTSTGLPILYPVSSYDRDHLPKVAAARAHLIALSEQTGEDKVNSAMYARRIVQGATQNALESQQWNPNRHLTSQQKAKYDRADQIGMELRMEAVESMLDSEARPDEEPQDLDEEMKKLEDGLSGAEKELLEKVRNGEI